MTNNEILNTRNLPKTNRQIQKSSPKRIAIAIADCFLYRNIESMGRDFDNYWENGRTEQIIKEFAKIWDSNESLKRACILNPYFSLSMIGR